MRHGGRGRGPAHRRGPLEALDAAREAGPARRRPTPTCSIEGWRTVSRVRNAVTLVRGKGSDQLPSDTRERAAVASILGYPAGRHRRDGQRPAAHHAGLRAASSTGCSGDDGHDRPRRWRRLPLKLRVHQQEALAALAGAWAAGRRRAWVALPPGAGKTLVGLETIQDRVAAGAVGKAVVLGPNTAIQGQWERSARDLGLDVATDRSLTHAVTALTYQALAVFDPDSEVDDDGAARGAVSQRTVSPAPRRSTA